MYLDSSCKETLAVAVGDDEQWQKSLWKSKNHVLLIEKGVGSVYFG